MKPQRTDKLHAKQDPAFRRVESHACPLRPLQVVLALLAIIAAKHTALAQSQTMVIDCPNYTVWLESGANRSFIVESEGQRVFRLPVVAAVSAPGQEEILGDIQLDAMKRDRDGAQMITATAKSSIWTERKYVWKFFSEHIEFQQFLKGNGPIGRCYFFSAALPVKSSADPMNRLAAANADVAANTFFSPRVNHADQYYYTVAMPQLVGLNLSSGQSGDYPIDVGTNLFATPLMIAFHRDGRWVSVGLGTKPGSYQFNTFDYSGQRYAGASFSVNYAGRTTCDGEFASPVVALHFGYNEYEVMAKYVAWLDGQGFSTKLRFANAPWHHFPLFCGWAQQEVECLTGTSKAGEMATQENYERWVNTLEARGLAVGTVVIDSKWDKHDGLLDVDEARWPDLKGFIARQHAKGRHVLLWLNVSASDGLAPELCVIRDGKAVSGDASNPAFEEFLRQRIKYLIADLGADGFKEDGVHGLDMAKVQQRGPLFGMEFLAKYQNIIADEAHKWRPDAMIETQTPNPLFRESSDVLRLNDIWYGSRDVTRMMKIRARISWIAGWPLVDTDNPGSAGLEQWWSYTQAQPTIGIPALYIVTATEGSRETVPDSQWKQLALIWNDYIARLNASRGQGAQ